MKKISILIPTFNEEENVELLCKCIKDEFKKNLPKYDYEIVFIDNCSIDNTQDKIKGLCKSDKRIKAIFNAKNFGQFNSPFYGLLQTTGDCTILMCADFQDPVEMIHKFVKEWENGYKIVVGIKNKSKENRFMYFIRTCYYKIIKKFSTVEQIEHFTGFGLYDKKFINILKGLEDSQPYLRGIVAELGYKRKEIKYTQPKRKYGKTKNNWYSLYDVGMIGITSYTKGIIRIATFFGLFTGLLSFAVGIIYLILKLVYWDMFSAGVAPILIGQFFIGSILLFFIGLLSEYILSINTRVMKRPLVVEESRINFDKQK